MSAEEAIRLLEVRDATIASLTLHLKALRAAFPEGYAPVATQQILRDVDSELAAQGEVRPGAVTWAVRK